METVLTNLSIIIASITAVYGIISWRREHVGKRKIDLAEEVLCCIYEIKDVLRFIRSPFGYEGEGSTRKRGEHERPRQSEALDRAFVVYERYNQQKEVFNKFNKLQYRYIANFGRSSGRPFEIVNEVMNQIFVASRMLGTIYWERDEWIGMTEQQIAKRNEEMRKQEEIFWEVNRSDEINTKIERAINICEEICKSANNLGFWNFIKTFRNAT